MSKHDIRAAYARIEERVSVSENLKRRTLEAIAADEAAQRAGTQAAAGGTRETDETTARRVARPAARERRAPQRRSGGTAVLGRPLIAAAACLALVVGVGALAATGSFERLAASFTGNYFELAYADEGELSNGGMAVGINNFFPTRTSAGYRYDPETKSADTSVAVASRTYNLNLTCTGGNIRSITYTAEGPDATFGSWTVPDADAATIEVENGHTFTVDYTRQNPERLVRELNLNYVLDASSKQEFDRLYEEAHGEVAADNSDIEAILARCDAERLARTTLTLTATFHDGSTQTKTYRIEPAADYTQTCLAYHEAKQAAGENGPIEAPALITLVER
ncbi:MULTISPECIES: hypothetical protein [Gordonibacter]|uniref:DUF4179 domain-containing protein n=1 Tax=Gordonibacter faecis TaxID=3047475 RepID=A0ABT7DP42_9ACTN|nr:MULTISPECIES: hypothetical protein [unclassified Gordonibacter]MDJ1651296.1 hypothetical protein [Gordonibacter sp. KGMB12511]HIW76298.1 hypothetical protein [Candidatus Gordonibacter avicola]